MEGIRAHTLGNSPTCEGTINAKQYTYSDFGTVCVQMQSFPAKGSRPHISTAPFCGKSSGTKLPCQQSILATQ